MVDEQRSLANSQVIIPGIALVIAERVLAVCFDYALSIALGIIAAAVGVGLLVCLLASAFVKHQRR